MRILFRILCLSCAFHVIVASDPSTLNGGSAMAMAGKECIALAVDKRFGSGSQMVNISPRHVKMLHPHLMVAFTGLEGDVVSVEEELVEQALKWTQRSLSSSVSSLDPSTTTTMRRRRMISPHAMAQLTSHVLHGRRSSPYFCEPLLVGLVEEESMDDPNNNDHTHTYRPFLCAQDVIGAQSRASDFICCGVASKSLYGVAEAMWKPDMDAPTLARVCGQAFLTALDRDCLSGYGAVVYVLTARDGITMYDLDTRID